MVVAQSAEMESPKTEEKKSEDELKSRIQPPEWANEALKEEIEERAFLAIGKKRTMS
jgi:hypothetical protein